MAKDTLKVKPTLLQTLGGVDESVSETDKGIKVTSVAGSFPFFHGMHHRMFGKKIIDWNPGQKVLNIHQAFNGICLYGYYVETNNKLYFHPCMAPPDLRIHWLHLVNKVTFVNTPSVHWRLLP